MFTKIKNQKETKKNTQAISRTAIFMACAALAVFLVPTAIAPSLLQEAEARIGHPNNCTLPPCPWEESDSLWRSKGNGAGSIEIIAGGILANVENISGKESNAGISEIVGKSVDKSGEGSWEPISGRGGSIGSFEYIGGKNTDVTTDFVSGIGKSGEGFFEFVGGFQTNTQFV